MKKLFVFPLLILLIIFSLSWVSATPGAIWTTRENCDTPQDENQYNLGEHVWIRGEGFAAGDYDWEVKGQPGQASCDPSNVVASGSYTVNNSGSFCFNAYTVANDDCGVYKADFNNKYDNYHVIPEFGTVVGIITILGALGTFFVVRKSN